MWPFSSKRIVPVLRLSGTIGMVSPLRQGLTISALADPFERAFKMSKLPTVAMVINSPGGSAVQSHMIFRRLRQLAQEHDKKLIAFCEDVTASGGYFIAVAADEIYADPSSIVGSIGVISAGFGFDRAIEKLGIDRRVYTAGRSKSVLDPFRPENSDDVERIKALQRDVHDVFIGVVKDRRAAKLGAPDDELFSGAFWSGVKASELGLIDGLADVRTKMRELHGEKVELRVVPTVRRGLLSRFARLPGLALPRAGQGASCAAITDRSGQHTATGAIVDDIVATLEERAVWARYGL
ncbi:MAG: S49 family peptidase [Hyphomicrobiaceae bacterium]